MFSFGSNGLWTPRRRAVAGISCMSPRAPLRDTAVGTPFDSARMTAAMRAGSTLCSFAAARICEEYGEKEKKERDFLRRRGASGPRRQPARPRGCSSGLTRIGRSYSSSTMRSTTSSDTVIDPPPTSFIDTRSPSPSSPPGTTAYDATRTCRPSSKTTRVRRRPATPPRRSATSEARRTRPLSTF